MKRKEGEEEDSLVKRLRETYAQVEETREAQANEIFSLSARPSPLRGRIAELVQLAESSLVDAAAKEKKSVRLHFLHGTVGDSEEVRPLFREHVDWACAMTVHSPENRRLPEKVRNIAETKFRALVDGEMEELWAAFQSAWKERHPAIHVRRVGTLVEVAWQ